MRRAVALILISVFAGGCEAGGNGGDEVVTTLSGTLQLSAPRRSPDSLYLRFSLLELTNGAAARTLLRQPFRAAGAAAIPFSLDYNPDAIVPEHHYQLQVTVAADPHGERVLLQTGFPVLSGQPPVLNLAIQIPPEPVESR